MDPGWPVKLLLVLFKYPWCPPGCLNIFIMELNKKILTFGILLKLGAAAFSAYFSGKKDNDMK